MKMYFHFTNGDLILFKNWKYTTTGGLIGYMFAIFLVAMAYEGCKYLREHLYQRQPRTSLSMWNGQHFIQTIFQMIQMWISYCLMLIVMTYNVWLILAVVVGSGVGYFLFGWKRISAFDTTDCCQ
ncbi:unnamed protein product [Brassicogethes aeneus]|uniref:Copper transport protein n=1 Tax=Brassicogethes aeneus TaxID=1431903 RepID=A0A9P0BEK5_BRAAE|nr:unnamed protein product [Brassicogethes aeneus]